MAPRVRQAVTPRRGSRTSESAWRRLLGAPLLPFLIPPGVILLQLLAIALFRDAFANHPGPAARSAAFIGAYSPALCLLGTGAAASHFKRGRRLMAITGIALNLGYMAIWGLFLVNAGRS